MKLSAKLSLAFGSLAVLIIFVGVFGLLQMDKVNDTSTDLARNWMPAAINIQDASKHVSDFRISEILHIYSEDEKELRSYEKNLAENTKGFNERVTAYERLIADEQERAVFKTFQEQYKQYMALHDKVLRLSQEMKTAEAIGLLTTESRKLYYAMSESIEKLVNFNETGSLKVSDAGDVLFANSQKMVTVLLILAIVIATVVTIYIVRNTLGLLGKDPGELGAIARSVAAGNLDLQDDGKAVGVFKDILAMVVNLKKNIEAAQQESERARQESDRAQIAMQQAEASSKEAAAKAESILRAADRLEEVVGIVSSASEELSAQVEQSERGAAEQASRVSEMATAMEEMNCTVMEVARNAGEASDGASRTREKAEGGAGVVRRTVENIEKVQRQSMELKADMAVLGQHAHSISEIMGVISDIADQTNLLALNAAIEAARAGDAGRGFAVVADEVRKLAEKTMQSTTDVGNAIKAIQQSAEKNIQQVDATVTNIEASTALAVQSGESLQEIVSMVDASADQVRAIATASEQQSATSEEINRAVTQVNTIATETARAMQEASQAVSDLARQAQVLTRLVDDMKRG